MAKSLVARAVCAFLFSLIVAGASWAAPGSLLGVTLTPLAGGDSAPATVVVQADGKAIFVGFADVGAPQFALVRYNTDGSLDTTYGTNQDGIQLQSLAFAGSFIARAALQGDGKLVVVGSAMTDGGTSRFAVARFGTDGTLDSSFGNGGTVIAALGPADSGAQAIAIQGDGKIVVGGYSRGASNQVFAVARFNADGTFDTGFGTQGVVTFSQGSGNEGVGSLLLRSDGSIVVAGGGPNYLRYAALTPSGAIDSSFAGGSGTIAGFGPGNVVAQQADGKLVIGGSFNSLVAVARINADGTVDTAFGNAGVASLGTFSFAYVSGVFMQPDGRIVAGGSYLQNGNYITFTTRFNADGTYDSSFGIISGTFAVAGGIAQRSGGGYLVAGWKRAQTGNRDWLGIALASDGSLDTVFNHGNVSVLELGADTAIAQASAQQADGKVVVAGTDSSRSVAAVERYNADGTLDTAFRNTGETLSICCAAAVAIQPDAKIVMAGNGFMRLNTDGSLDRAFGSNSLGSVPPPAGTTLSGVAIQGNGAIVGVGSNSSSTPSHSAVVRITPSGAMDTTFAGSGMAVIPVTSGYSDQLNAVAIQGDGKIVAVGKAWTSNTQYAWNMVVMRLNTDGTLDTTFGAGGIVNLAWGQALAEATALAIQPDGAIVVGGSVASSLIGPYSFALARLTATGTLDSGFGSGGTVQTRLGDDDQLHALALLADGKIVAGGWSGALLGLAQYLPNGSLDTSFGTGGIVRRVISRNAKPSSRDGVAGITVASDGTLNVGAAAGPLFALARFAGESDTGTIASASVSSASSANPSMIGQAVTLSATVTGSAGTPTGFVDFVLDGGSGMTGCNRLSLSNGSAQCAGANLSAGSHTITVLYSGDGTYGSASSSLTQVVNKANASIALTSSANPSSPRMPVTFTATISGSFGTPTGIVAFNDGGTAISGCEGIALTMSGTASCTTYALAAGSHSITAGYSGDGQYNGGSSAALTEVEQPIGANDTNWALATNGGVASASSQYGSGYPIAAINNGDRKGLNWSNGGGWADGTVGVFPDWVEIDFNGTKQIDTVTVYTLQDNWQNPSLPTDIMTFSQYGVTDFNVQGWDGTQWVTLATVAGNRNVVRNVAVTPFNTTKIRVNVTGGLAGLSRITEVEAWGVPATGSATPINVALQGNGGVASASSQYGNGFPVSAINNGERAGASWTNGGGWADGTLNQWPDWVEVDFGNPASLTSVVVYTVQDNWQSPAEPNDTMTFTQYGVTAFNVQGWDGSQWVTLGTVSGNNLVKRTVTFNAFVTSKIRVNVTGALASLSRITELEAWGVPQAPAQADANVALASTGATVLASSGRGLNFPESAIIDNERAGAKWTAGGGWADSTLNNFPDWVEIHFNGAQTIDKAVVYTVQDNWQSPVEPTDTMTFTQYGITDFLVQAWDGTQWVTLATVSGNNLVKRTVTFAPFTTTIMRIYVTNALAGLSRITEVEAWGFPANPPALTNWALPSNGGVATASSQYDANFPVSAAINGDTAGTNWSAGGGWADATVAAWPDWLQVTFPAPHSVRQVTLYTLQDNWQNPAQPTNDMMFTQYGITDFEVQGWDGTQWQTLGTVNNNYFVMRTVAFPAFYTDRIRVVVTRSLGSLSRITELQAWGN